MLLNKKGQLRLSLIFYRTAQVSFCSPLLACLAPQHTELLFQRYQSSFIHTLDVGRQLFSMGDEETQNRLQTDLGTLQEEWDNLHSLLGRRMDLTEAIVKVLSQLPCQNCTYNRKTRYSVGSRAPIIPSKVALWRLKQKTIDFRPHIFCIVRPIEQQLLMTSTSPAANFRFSALLN